MRLLRLHQIDATTQPDGKVPTVSSGVLVFATPSGGSTRSTVPLTTAIGSAPDFVWDDTDELVQTEVTL